MCAACASRRVDRPFAPKRRRPSHPPHSPTDWSQRLHSSIAIIATIEFEISSTFPIRGSESYARSYGRTKGLKMTFLRWSITRFLSLDAFTRCYYFEFIFILLHSYFCSKFQRTTSTVYPLQLQESPPPPPFRRRYNLKINKIIGFQIRRQEGGGNA